MNPPPRPFERAISERGMSLVEIIVVIALLACLMLLLSPALSRMRQISAATKCVAQLRTAGSAFHQYIADMNGEIVTRRGGGGRGSIDIWGAELSKRGYLVEPARADGHRSYTGQDPAALTCPVLQKKYPANYTMENWAWFTYGLNLFSPGLRSVESEDGVMLSKRRVTSIERPSEFVLLADSVNGNGAPYFRISSGNGGFALSHGRVGNVLFFDGHIKALSREEAVALNFPSIHEVPAN